MRENLFRLSATVRDLGIKALLETKKDYIALNVDQFKHGKKPSGRIIGRYSGSKMGQEYAALKHEQNPLAGKGNVDLMHKHDFIEALDIEAHGTKFEEFSHDIKQNVLVEMYAEDEPFYGLSEANLQKYRKDSFKPALMPKVREVVYK